MGMTLKAQDHNCPGVFGHNSEAVRVTCLVEPGEIGIVNQWIGSQQWEPPKEAGTHQR